MAGRSGSAGGGLAAIRERRGGARGGAAPGDTAGVGGKAEGVGFKRLGVVHGPSQRQRAEERTRRTQALQRKNRDNQSQNQSERAGSSSRGVRKTESAPTTTRPAPRGQARGGTASGGVVDAATGRAGARGTRPTDHKQGNTQITKGKQEPKDKTQDVESKADADKAGEIAGHFANLDATVSPPKEASSPQKVEILDGRVAKTKATHGRKALDSKISTSSIGTADIMRALAGVQARESKRTQDNNRSVAADENLANSSISSSFSSSRKGGGEPLQALMKGPGGRSGKGGAGVEDSMAALLAAKAAKLQSQFDKADKIAGAFVVDEAECLAQSMDIDEISAVAQGRK